MQRSKGYNIFIFGNRVVRRFWAQKPPRNRAIYLKNKEKAREVITSRVEYFSNIYGFKYNKISIRNQITRWGSCSSKGNLNFNYRLIFLPERLRDYVVVHELCHLKELNHGKSFWALVAEQVPDYSNIRKKLRGVLLGQDIDLSRV